MPGITVAAVTAQEVVFATPQAVDLVFQRHPVFPVPLVLHHKQVVSALLRSGLDSQIHRLAESEILRIRPDLERD